MTRDLLQEFEPMMRAMAFRAAAGLGSGDVEDALQIARVSFSWGLQAKGETLETGLLICYARGCVRRGLNNWRRARFAQRRNPWREVSMDAPILEDGSNLHGILPAPPPPEGLPEQTGLLLAAVDALPARDKTIVLEYYWADRTMAEIAQRMGMTRQRVQQILAAALEVLRRKIGEAEAMGEFALCKSCAI
jgi:RNA polymerase sigma factor (sigma-70 family)